MRASTTGALFNGPQAARNEAKMIYMGVMDHSAVARMHHGIIYIWRVLPQTEVNIKVMVIGFK
jgi:hypothetical protein